MNNADGLPNVLRMGQGTVATEWSLPQGGNTRRGEPVEKRQPKTQGSNPAP